MELGAFSISLSVKDLSASQHFYECLGFSEFGGDKEQGYVMLRNGEHVIGLFQGMFENNIITFNPGWDQHCGALESFTDVRQIQSQLKQKGVSIAMEADADATGPANILLADPDGNQILIDQHR